MLTFYRPGVMPNLSHLENGARTNRDGHGFAVIVGDRIERGRGMSADAVIEAFDKVRRAHPESYAIFHSRYTTHGLTNEANCHPFFVAGDSRTVLAHNGILPQGAQPLKGDERSDTRILAEDLIPAGVFGHLTNRRARRRLARWMGIEKYPNKIAILTVDPRYGRNAYLINEHLGEWKDGIWYSNSGWCDFRTRYGGSYGYYWDDVTYPRIGAATGRVIGHPRSDNSTGPGSAGTSPTDGAWRAYLRGEISYDDYLTEAYRIYREESEYSATGWPSDVNPRGNCPYCGEEGAVNLAVGYCTACLWCVDCESPQGECECYVPGDSAQWRDLSGSSRTDRDTARIADAAMRGIFNDGGS